MNEVFSLDPMICLYDAATTVPRTSQKVVLIDVGRRAVTASAGWFREVRSYLVSNTGDARNVGTGCISGWQLKDLECSVAVTLTFDARCRPGNEEKVALALFGPVEVPGKVLENHLTNWLAGMSENVAAFVDAYFVNPRAIEAELATRARTELGVELRARLTLDAERSLNAIVVSDALLVTVSDYDTEQRYIEFKASLEVDERTRTRAILQSNRFDELHELVPREIGKFIRQNVPMQTFYMQLNGPAVREPLTRHLNEMLAPFGRRIETLTLESDEDEVQVHFQDDVDVACHLHQYPREVKISNKVQMILTDVARYRAAKAPPLNEWLREKLKRFIPQTLFGARYIDVLLRFDPREREIKQHLSDEAAAIGYDIQQFVTVPDLAPLRWKDPFLVETSGSFATRQSDVFVKLEVAVTVRIPNLEKIEDLLNLDQDVPSVMPGAIHQVVAQYLHGCDPERFYIRFNFTDKPGEITVEQALMHVITEELIRRFHAEVIGVVVKMADAEPKIRLRALQEKICPFEVHVDSLHANDPLIFGGTFQVDAVDENGWNKFQMLPATLDEIRRYLEGHLGSELQTEQVRHILFRRPEEQEDLTDRLRKSAVDYVRRQFGLSINVDSIRRELTPWERAALQVELDRTHARLTIAKSDLDRTTRLHIAVRDEREAQLTKLLQERTRLALAEATPEEIEEMEQKIAEAEQKLPPEPIPSMGSVQTHILHERGRRAPAGALGPMDEETQPPAGEAE